MLSPQPLARSLSGRVGSLRSMFWWERLSCIPSRDVFQHNMLSICFPHVSHFLPSSFLYKHDTTTHSLLATHKRWKKANKHKPRLSLDSAVVPEMLFKGDTWSIFPFHLDALTPLSPTISNMDLRCSCLSTLPPAPPSWKREG